MDGVVLVDKPAGKSSFDVVAAVRRRLSAEESRRVKVGHAGTLDPFATGLLIVLVGRATRCQRYLMGLPKRYETVARLGATSTTGDPEGEIEETGRVPPDPPSLPTGTLMQRPPAYSAVKVAGERAYRRARRGEAVFTEARPVTVHEFRQLWREDDRAGFLIECSTGTYVRSLIADLGDAYCLELRRTSIGPFCVDEADEERVLGLDEALRRFMPAIALDADEARAAGHGRPVAGRADGPVRLLGSDGLIAIAEPAGAGTLRVVVGLR